MSIDVFREEVLSLSEAAKRLPKVRNGKKLHVSTIYRWTLAGKQCRDGFTVRLESIKIGGSTCTSLEALQRFFDRLTGELNVISPPTITERQRLRRMEELERQAKELGV